MVASLRIYHCYYLKLSQKLKSFYSRVTYVRSELKISYSNAKEVVIYRAFVENPKDRKARKDFKREFGAELMEPAVKLHERLKKYPNAAKYNDVFGKTKNRIGFVRGISDNKPFVLKVRVGGESRKFFRQVINDKGILLKAGDWKGNFNETEEIYVIAVNNHDYNEVSK